VLVLELRDHPGAQRIGDDGAAAEAARRRICVLARCPAPGLAPRLNTELDGCVVTDMAPEAFIDALKAIAARVRVDDRDGPAPTSGKRRPSGNGQRHPDTLSARETEVARLVAEGLANKVIAARLSISSKTVETHITHIMEKLHVCARTQIAAHLFRNGLV
jgi:DNA-binding NarL/FixJ family response regulator